MRPGRPRGFDTDAALGAALQVFWKYGYDAASLVHLRTAMGISSASFYAAFASKDALFELVLERYASSYGQATAPAADEALAPRTAIEQTLTRSAHMQTDPSHPAGCLLVLSASTCSSHNSRVHRILETRRAGDRRNISRCIARAVEGGALPRDTQQQALAALFYGLLVGMSVQARDGVSRHELVAAVGYAMQTWDALALAAEGL